MLFAYCVRAAGDPPPPPALRGVQGRAVSLLGEGELAFWVSPGPLPAATVEHLEAHDRVLRAALRSATPLPVRYGAASFADEAAARAALREHAAPFAESLRRLAGHVEMGVRVEWLDPPPEEEAPEGPVRSGREYLERRRAAVRGAASRRAAAERLLEQAASHFNSFPVQAVRHVVADAQIAGSLAHLVHRSELERYRREAEGAREALPGCRLILSGPWAPYSFV